MNDIGDSLLMNRDPSERKSYLIGLERGRIWAMEYADYFDMRGYCGIDIAELGDLKLPEGEERHFRVISMESPLEWRAYISGWLAGVKESSGR